MRFPSTLRRSNDCSNRQTSREAGTQSHGSTRRKVRGQPGRRKLPESADPRGNRNSLLCALDSRLGLTTHTVVGLVRVGSSTRHKRGARTLLRCATLASSTANAPATMHQASQLKLRASPAPEDHTVSAAHRQLLGDRRTFAPYNRREEHRDPRRADHRATSRAMLSEGGGRTRLASGDSSGWCEGERGSGRASRGRSTPLLEGGDASKRGGWGFPRLRTRSAAPSARRVLVAVGTAAALPLQGD
jgi:hypothetical protein